MSITPFGGKHRLTDLVVDEISLVFDGDDPTARVLLAKSAPVDEGVEPVTFTSSVEKASARPTLERAPGKSDNWIEERGGLPPYIDKIARAVYPKMLARAQAGPKVDDPDGKAISAAIAIAVNQVKEWAAGGEDVNPDTRAKAAAALAQWEAMKVSKSDVEAPPNGLTYVSTLSGETTEGVHVSAASSEVEKASKPKTDEEDVTEVTDETVEETAEVDADESADETNDEAGAGEDNEAEANDLSDLDLTPEAEEYVRALESEIESLLNTVEDLEENLAAAEADQDTPADEDDEVVEKSAADADLDSIEEAIAKSSDPAVIEVLRKAAAERVELIAKAAEAEEIAKAAEEQRVQEVYISKAAGYTSLGVSERDKVAAALRAIDGLPADVAETVSKMLDTSRKQVEASGAFREVGTSPRPEVSIRKSAEAAVDEIRKSNPELTKEQALVQALRNDPALYSAMHNEEI